MNRAFVLLAAAGMVCSSALAESPVQPGDVVVGLNAGFEDSTTEQARVNGDGNAIFLDRFEGVGLTFSQSAEFDNSGGSTQNAAGNLFMLSFGPPPSGPGSLYVYSTDGTQVGTNIHSFDTTATTTLTRAAGLGVATDNSVLSTYGFTTGRIVFTEISNPTPGDGLSVTVSDAWETGVEVDSGTTQGTAWLDADTMVMGAINFGNLEVLTFDVDIATNTYTVTQQITSGLAPGLSPSHVSTAYNASVSPYVFILWGSFDGIGTQNALTIIDPSDFSIVNQIELDNSLGTGRECNLGPNGELYMGQFNDRIDVIPDATSNAAGLANDSSVDFYLQDATASFAGLAVAASTTSVVPVGACCGAFVPGGTQDNINTTEADCIARTGSYSGDGTDAADCPPLVGACCVNNTCSQQTQVDCDALSGTFLGGGLSCTDNGVDPYGICPGTRTGACCFTDGSCTDGSTGSDCFNAGGIYLGDDTTCASDCNLPSGQVAKEDFDLNSADTELLVPDNTANNGAFPGSIFDVWGITNRDVNNAFADDSLSIFPADEFGILKEAKIDNVFGAMDTDNNDNPGGAVSGTWTFDISNFADIHVAIDFAALGNFEASDTFTFNATIDAGAPTAIFTTLPAEGGTPLITLESGTIVFGPDTDDPMQVFSGARGALVINDFVTLVSDNLGAGTTLTLEVTGVDNGFNEIFIFDNICVLGNALVAGGACCAAVEPGCVNVGSEAECTAIGGTYQGDGSDCMTATCGCPCDRTGEGTTNINDLLDFLSDWFAQDGMAVAAFTGADFNGDGMVNITDLLAFLSCWFFADAGNPCPA